MYAKLSRSIFFMTVLVLLLASGCTLSQSETGSGKDPTPSSSDTIGLEAERMELASTWAAALQARDGKPRYAIMSKNAKEKFEAEQIIRSGEDWNYVIGDSSPWVVDYDIVMDDMTATIHYTTQTSEPAYYSASETIRFDWENGKLVVDDYFMDE